MNILAISGSPRKASSTEKLLDKAVEGLRSKDKDIVINKICLIDYDIKPCYNCLKCRDAETDQPFVRCSIHRDGMDELYDLINNADGYIIGNPLHSGNVTGLVSIFLERVVWCFAEPKGKVLGVTGIPMPRNPRKRKLALIITNARVPPYMKIFCNSASKHIKMVLNTCLNTKLTGDLYAGAIETRGIECYLDKAFKLGQKIAG